MVSSTEDSIGVLVFSIGMAQQQEIPVAMLPPDMDLLLTSQIVSDTQYHDAMSTLTSSWPSSFLSSA
eukprot:CAMPEP_0176499174 /NCGR_PEP_ID=MMETSP0200_2-20121128/12766_1 /TAXON_ID=947934 /ORGANISM="Chaetoceros sp., Strain GSL56" /LENGTH=66 /DNA_ID=CAMNT_0017897535 /DNA_START=243 /DNA_END=440 /DNA_ORIENTATION=+